MLKQKRINHQLFAKWRGNKSTNKCGSHLWNRTKYI